jgi:hypothetical protein
MATKKPAAEKNAKKKVVAKKTSSPGKVTKTKRAVSTAKTSKTKKPIIKTRTIPVGAPSADTVRKAIVFFYLLSYCPPSSLGQFIRTTQSLRENLASGSEMESGAFFRQIVPEVSRRIVAFHQATREPDPKYMDELTKATLLADRNPESLTAFQTKMAEIAMLPGRTKAENRLHRNKGCSYCKAPCLFGFFTLVSEPKLAGLQALIALEAQKPAAQQSPLSPVYNFTIQHMQTLTGVAEGAILAKHFVNLSYCLMMLGMAKSRLAIPDKELQLFQAANQRFIHAEIEA